MTILRLRGNLSIWKVQDFIYHINNIKFKLTYMVPSATTKSLFKKRYI